MTRRNQKIVCVDAWLDEAASEPADYVVEQYGTFEARVHEKERVSGYVFGNQLAWHSNELSLGWFKTPTEAINAMHCYRHLRGKPTSEEPS